MDEPQGPAARSTTSPGTHTAKGLFHHITSRHFTYYTLTTHSLHTLTTHTHYTLITLFHLQVTRQLFRTAKKSSINWNLLGSSSTLVFMDDLQGLWSPTHVGPGREETSAVLRATSLRGRRQLRSLDSKNLQSVASSAVPDLGVFGASPGDATGPREVPGSRCPTLTLVNHRYLNTHALLGSF